jgi:hypothetical protein
MADRFTKALDKEAYDRFVYIPKDCVLNEKLAYIKLSYTTFIRALSYKKLGVDIRVVRS